MSQTPANKGNNIKLMTDLAESWISQQSKVNRLIAIQDLELRDNLVGSLTRFVLNETSEHELSKASMTFLGRISDLISTGSLEAEKKLHTAKKAIKVLMKSGALEGVDQARIADIKHGVSVVPGVLDKEEWIAARLSAKDPFAIDPGFDFNLDHDAIDKAANGYIKGIKDGREDMPDYQHLCQNIETGKLESQKELEYLLDVFDGKIKVSSTDSLVADRPVKSEREGAAFSRDLGL